MSNVPDGYIEITNIKQIERRSNQYNDPRWIFYSALLSCNTVSEYREVVGAEVVYPSTYNGKVTSENELKYVVFDRKWVNILPLYEKNSNDFIPDPTRDERIRTYREIIQRQGQQKFRRDLLEAYDFRCAISECSVLQLLDAAHITPYLGLYTNNVQNGILLRTDLHTLWDLALLAVDPLTMKVRIATSALSADPYYASLDGKLFKPPKSSRARPSSAALGAQWKDFCERSDDKLSGSQSK